MKRKSSKNGMKVFIWGSYEKSHDVPFYFKYRKIPIEFKRRFICASHINIGLQKTLNFIFHEFN